ncbi:MAG: shikimate dehydrogenase [Cyclobacteriaceae bacterium]|nr:shikimate dehydrogenase [Cyclobacteriaceae bacterium]
MKTFGLIGRKLSHSFSKQHFENKFNKEKIVDCEYQLFEIENINSFTQLIENHPTVVGLNVTIPYKHEVIPFMDNMDESAAKVGAVNVIKVETLEDGNKKFTGFNTDYLAFKNSLEDWLNNRQIKALVLGTGGAAQAICTALNELLIPFLSVSRSSENGLTYEELNSKPEIIKDHHLIINTTPLGMYPNIDDLPDIDYSLLSNNHHLYDLVYNPEITQFMKRGNDRNTKTKNGLEMLYLQAEYSWKIWTNS